MNYVNFDKKAWHLDSATNGTAAALYVTDRFNVEPGKVRTHGLAPKQPYAQLLSVV